MANLIIKSSANDLVIQGSDESPAITVAAAGTTTFAENATLSGSANALGTVASGDLSNQDIVMPRVKEVKRFYYPTKTADTGAVSNSINISGSNSCGPFTPEHNDDIFIMQWNMAIWINTGYMGWGVDMDDASGFPSPTHIHAQGRHLIGNYNATTVGGIGDYAHYSSGAGSFSCTASQISATVGTAWYFRMVGQAHQTVTNCVWGEGETDQVIGEGVTMSVQRWSMA